jgi:hypothetical protein
MEDIGKEILDQFFCAGFILLGFQILKLFSTKLQEKIKAFVDITLINIFLPICSLYPFIYLNVNLKMIMFLMDPTFLPWFVSYVTLSCLKEYLVATVIFFIFNLVLY